MSEVAQQLVLTRHPLQCSAPNFGDVRERPPQWASEEIFERCHGSEVWQGDGARNDPLSSHSWRRVICNRNSRMRPQCYQALFLVKDIFRREDDSDGRSLKCWLYLVPNRMHWHLGTARPDQYYL